MPSPWLTGGVVLIGAFAAVWLYWQGREAEELNRVREDVQTYERLNDEPDVDLSDPAAADRWLRSYGR